MQKESPQKFKFWNDYSYGTRLIKGVSRDQIMKHLTRYPLLMKFYKKNTPQIQTKIIDTFMRQPSTSDCPGFIYGFKDYSQHQKNPYSEKYQIKMGRTKKQVPQNRIYEWEDDDGHQYVEIFTIRSQFNNKLQALVHLFYAYARRVKIINGKRRIEWFNFEEKTLNAAVTCLINELMEKIHHLGKINQLQKPCLSYDLESFCTNINEQISSIQFLKRKLIIVGPKSSGKSVLKAMLNGQKLNVVQSRETSGLFGSSNLLEIEILNNCQAMQNIIELSHSHSKISNDSDLMQRFKKSFILWSKINSTQQIGIPCLVITQNDLLSSEMIGFRKAFHDYLKSIKIPSQFDNNSQQNSPPQVNQKLSNFKLFLIVNKIHKDRKYTQQKVKNWFQSNKSLFSIEQNKILQNCSIFFITQPIKEGKLNYDVEEIIRQIHNFDHGLMKSVSFEFSDPFLTKICEETIHYAYQEVGQKFEDYLKSSLKKISQNFETQKLLSGLGLKEEEDQQNQQQNAVKSLELINLKFRQIQSVENILNKLRLSTKQQQVLINLKMLHLILNIQGTDSTISQLLAFCECMLKLSTSTTLDHVQGQDFEKKQDLSHLISPMYLSNSLLFTKLQERINRFRQQLREEINHIIENELKLGLEKIFIEFYGKLDESTPQKKELFNKVYQVLFRIMNIDSAIQSQRAEKKLTLETVSNETIEQQILIKSLNELIELSGSQKPVHSQSLRAIIKLISLVYEIVAQFKIRTVNIVSRIRQAIYVASKGKKQIPIIGTNNNQTTEDAEQSKNQTYKNKKPYYNNSKPNHYQFDSNTKVILNKKDEVKNQKLLNFINAKKKQIQQSLQAQLNQQQRNSNQTNSQDINHSNQSRNEPSPKNNSIQKMIINHPKKPQQKQISQIKKSQKEIIQISDEEVLIYPSINQNQIYQKVTHQQKKDLENQMVQEDEYFSIPSSGDDQQKKSYNKALFQLQKLQIQEQSQSNVSQINKNQFETFVDKLLNSFHSIKHNFSSIPSLKSLNQIVLFKIIASQSFYSYTLNFSQQQFVFDLPFITLHNSFVMIFAKKVAVENQCEINFKVHYKNRKPNKINFILVSESYEGVQKLKIQDHKYGKVLMIEVLKKSEKKYKVVDGYFTKNKRNEKKLQDLRVRDLVESYCKIIN